MSQLAMSKREREQFLAAVHVGVLAVNGDGSPVVTPIWYTYEPGGDVVITTGTQSVKAVALRAAGSASVCVQTETAPYGYVVVDGPVSVQAGVDPSWRRAVARRYLGAELGDLYTQSTMDQEPSAVTVRLTPERWRTADFGKQAM